MVQSEGAGPEQSVVGAVLEQSARVLETYRIDPGLIQEHANGERRIFQGGYGDRQIYELVQNGADEVRARPGGEIRVVLTTNHLYVANEGSAFTAQGVQTILRMGVSHKRGGQIGRFGVGVKSVLSITDSPEFYSSSGSFGFDREWSAERIRAVHPEADETPVLRMARPYDSAKTSAVDPVLAELLAWATTVVRLPLKPSAVDRIARDLQRFPGEFALFAPHVGTVIVEDRRPAAPFRRELFARREGDRHTIQTSTPNQPDLTEVWRVFTRVHVPSGSARGEAGELHDRPEVDVSWAVPEQNLNKRGEFWAYFPTNYNTTLRGIVNAPWKTSEDRQNLFAGNRFNAELIKVAAELITDTLPELVDAEDPGSYLGLMPARGREAAQWADEELTKEVYALAAVKPSLPDQDGVLQPPAQLELHPRGLSESWLALWAGYDKRPKTWCHHSIEHRERRNRVEQIRVNAKLNSATAREWLEALTADQSAESSARAVKILAAMYAAGGTNEEAAKARQVLEDALKARVILTEAHGLVAPIRGKVFRRPDGDRLQENLVYVDPAVADFDHDTARALDHLGIHEADAAGRFESMVEQGFDQYADRQWTDFWELARLTGPHGASEILQRRTRLDGAQIKVRTVSGRFRFANACLTPGAVVPGDGSRDAQIAVDPVFHGDDHALLERLGLSALPTKSVDPRRDEWFVQYTATAHEEYCKALPANASRPHLSSMRLEGANPAGPLSLLIELSEEGRAAFVRHLPTEGLISSWTMRAGGNSAKSGILSPLAWMVRRYGLVTTGGGLRKPGDAVGPALREYDDVLPVARIGETLAAVLKLADSLEKVPQRVWVSLFQEVSQSTEDEFPGRAYALKLQAGPWYPDGVTTRCRVGDEWTTRPDDEIAVAADRAEYNTLLRERIPALLAPSAEDAARMAAAWGMKRLDEVVEKELRYAADADPVPLTEEFPYLRVRFGGRLAEWTVVRCTQLEHVVRTPLGLRTEELDSAIEGHAVLVRSPDDDLAVLAAVDRELKLGLGAAGCQGVLDSREKQREDERIQRARRASGDVDKLVELLNPEALKRGLPGGLLESEEADRGQSASAKRLAQLAVNAYGDGVLRQYKDDLAKTFSDGMGDFRGSAKSRQFVADLGFSETFAGAKPITLPEVEHVDGPIEYPALHSYQERIVDTTVALLGREVPGRAMLCLPTGAGKTRVAAEAVIRSLRAAEFAGPVLWIAQTQELCEQAVQSWRFVWSKVGAEGRLTISRLWSTNEATPVTTGPHLVVATDAKLENCLDTEAYAWLCRAAVVIVDEAHASITPRYTAILKALGLTSALTRRPLIGLTATPYRGVNEAETHRLVERYGRSRLDDGVFDGDPYKALQGLGMLAQVEHEVLAGADLTLNEHELKQMGIGGLLPSTAEQRLARNEGRNRAILERIARFPEDWPTLLFATSVDHARVLAARLNDRGVRAAAIDSATPTADRRARVEQFRSGELRVLTNYGVLAQGFDAPATRAVVVARPTYSPNVYQQMIGRGLRGPKNGGQETCLILNVQDNITNYGTALAFTAFEHLWSGQ